MPKKRALPIRSAAVTLFHETRAALHMTTTALTPRRRERFPDYHTHCLVLPGFMAPARAYYDLALFLRSYGFRTRVANFGWVNRPSYTRQVKLLHENVERFLKEVGDLEIVVGHSLGGLEAVGLLAEYSSIKKVIAIATPFSNGTPWRIVEFGARVMIKVPEAMQGAMLRKIVKKGRRFADRITTIATGHDKLVPPDYASFPGGNNVVIEDIPGAERSEQRRYLTHIALPNSPYVRNNIILPEISDH